MKTLLNTAILQMDGGRRQKGNPSATLPQQPPQGDSGAASGCCNLCPRVIGTQIELEPKFSQACEFVSIFLRQTSKRRENRSTNLAPIAATPEISVRVRTKHKPGGTAVPQESLPQNSENARVVNKRNSAVRQMQRDENQFR